MDFNKTVCENFFDYSRELNHSNGIIEAIYHAIYRLRKENKSILLSLEKRLNRSTHACSTAEDFIKLAKTSFRNQKLRKNQIDKYLAILFFTGEWINDNARLYVDDVKMCAVKEQLVLAMALVLTSELKFTSRSDWYEFVTRENLKTDESSNESFDYTVPVFLGFLIAYLLK